MWSKVFSVRWVRLPSPVIEHGRSTAFMVPSFSHEGGARDYGRRGGIERNRVPNRHYVVGRLLSNRPFNAQAMTNTMRLIWKPAKDMSIDTIDDNCFLFKFVSCSDLDRFIEGRPWFFDRHILLLEEIGLSATPRSRVLETMPFWLWLYNLPIAA